MEKETISADEIVREDPKGPKYRITLTPAEWVVLARTLCYALAIDEKLRPKGRGFWDVPESRPIADRLLDKVLLAPRRRIAGKRAILRRLGIDPSVIPQVPDYRDLRWHRKPREKSRSE